MTQNQIQYWNLKETERSNKAKERETNRSNIKQEELKDAANQINLLLGQGNIAEQIRSNLAKELENNRSNLANEDIKRIQNTIDALNALTNSRNADTREGELAYSYANLAELNRSHLANEALTAGNLQELITHNRNAESETNRSNLAREEETNRSNIANENIKRFGEAVSGGASITRNNLEDLQIKENMQHNRTTEGETKRNNITNQIINIADILAGLKKNSDNNAASIIRELIPSVVIRR